ncbi:MAG: hypothetical protein A2176_07845 [Spirochaetes bacterium RBG_13_51_14]|nr:MAG: hypothetical protein A2176_07845 [Spirochaetes bacterium RBG_13_51_14]
MRYFRRHIVRFCAVVAALAVMQFFGPIIPSGAKLGAAEISEGVKNYFLLQKHYTSWHEGLFGSRRFHERKLWDFLLRLLGKEITTDYDFMLSSPEGLYDKTMTCVFQYNRWLHIHGDLDLESVKKVTGMDGAAMMGWWRSKVLVAVTGKVKKFKLDWDAQGDTVHLYLDKVTVLYNDEKK